jgi:hypothetical protein
LQQNVGHEHSKRTLETMRCERHGADLRKSGFFTASLKRTRSMSAFAKSSLPLAVLLAFLLVALAVGDLSDPEALKNWGAGFAQIAGNRWLCVGLIALILLSLVTMLVSQQSRRAYQLFWGGVFVGIGLAICVSFNAGFGLALASVGSMLAGPRSLVDKRGERAP